MVDAGAAPIDRYVVLEHLSEGGMGAIYVGKKLGAGGFEMEVVLKQLLPEFTQQEEFIDLFLREAKLSATLDHANIVHTIDLVTAGGEYFIVMEYLPGGDLRTLLKRAKRRGKRFSPAAAIYICREVLSALAYAHVKRDFEGTPLRLIHRDVSPSNILVSYAGEVKLTDFGIAKAATHNSLFYKVKGKIGYMSPEQARSEPLDHRSDLYSLAVCMYEVLTGERLFVHAGLTTPAEEIYSQPVPPVSRKVPGLTSDLDAIMAKALALSPDARYQTAGEFQEALTRCAHRNGLLMSAPEVARELLDRCGPHDQWRGEDDDDDLGYVRRAATEVYDGGGEDDDEDGRPSSPSLAALRPGSRNSSSRISSSQAPSSQAPSSRAPSSRASSSRASSSRAPSSRAPSSRASSSQSSRLSRPRSDVPRLQGVVELTSIINMIDLEQQHRDSLGDKPLIDLDDGGLDDGRLGDGRLGDGRLGDGRLDDGRLGDGSPDSDPGLTEPLNRLGPPGSPGPAGPAGPPGAMPRGLPPAQAGHARLQAPRTSHPTPPVASYQAALHAPPADPRDALPTQPRPAPQPQAPAPHAPAQRRGSHVRRASVIQPWMVIVAILVAAATAGIVVAISGPDVTVRRGK